MLPLKRLLNEETVDISYQGMTEEESIRNEIYKKGPYRSEIPIFDEEVSWEGLWNSILSEEFPCNEDSFTTIDKVNDSPIHNVEEGIESWAAQSLPSINNLSLDSQETSPPPVSLDNTMKSSLTLCYGMIYRVAVKVGGNLLEVDQNIRANFEYHIEDSCKFAFRHSSIGKDVEISLIFPNGAEFGLLNIQAAKALEQLILKPNLEFEAIGSIRTIREFLGNVTKAADAMVRVNINIYGPKESCQEIGNYLSTQKLYLQRPDRLQSGSVYENPHVLSFPDIQLSGYENQAVLETNKISKLDDSENFKNTISNIYSSLTRGANLSKVEGDRRLKTLLLPHQKEALDFMLQRENGPIPPEFCLWKAAEGENEGWYIHAVTKARSRVLASETGGGVLADEMGMGKSLSTLALITNTLDKAYDWVVQKSKMEEESPEKPCRATLILVPSAILIDEWLHEMELHLDGTMRTLRYHGASRSNLVLEDADIVITTYHTMVSDFRDKSIHKSSPLHTMEWYRVVLDEAHIIRRHATTFFRAATDIKARSRWCLTGTPIQNKLEDVGSLFAFIRAHPFHSTAMFRRFVSIPFDESAARREIATKNLTLLLDSLCLRRSRELLNLPNQQDRVREVKFSPEEREQYEQTMKQMNRALRQKVGESASRSIFGMFQVQLQLRILCNHGTYQQQFSWTRRSLLDEREDALCSFGGNREVICSACRQSLPLLGSGDLYQKYEGGCIHVICRECLNQNGQSCGIDTNAGCPLCAISGVHTLTASKNSHSNHRGESYLRQEGYSSKMVALISDVKQDLWQTKSIIFSCWTNTLDLVERHLQKENLPFYRIDGETPLARRHKVLNEFSNLSKIPILIMTTGTGAFGLNLATANRVFIIEPQWNPSVENQAISRALRMNQKSSVIVTRYMIESSVEQEMSSQQKRKRFIAEIGNNSDF